MRDLRKTTNLKKSFNLSNMAETQRRMVECSWTAWLQKPIGRGSGEIATDVVIIWFS